MNHTEKTSRSAENKSSSQALKIDSPDSVHERQAASIAQHAGRNGQMVGSDQNQNGQIAGSPDAKNGIIAPAGVKEQINATKGSGDKLPDSVKGMVKAKAGELDDVRIHADSKAAELSEAVHADAFTIGQDIYFGQGKFEMYSSQGKELIAHEVAHALQNKEQPQEHSVIQRLEKADTAWGQFEELWSIPYKSVKEPYSEQFPAYGWGMYLKFTANDAVDATKIGLVQISKEYEGDKVSTGDSARDKHSLTGDDAKENSLLGESEKGFHVDRDKGDVNPLYAVTEAELGQSLSEGKTDAPVTRCDEGGRELYCGGGKHGEHYRESNGSLHEPTVPAELRDFPEFAIKKGHKAGAVFEVAALGLEGTQKGRYYGSAKWGYVIDESGVQTPIKLTTVSKGAASTTFLKAAEKWNADVNKKGEPKVITLPVPEFYELTEPTADFYVGAAFTESQKSSVDKPLRVERMDTREVLPESHKDLVPVRILEGEKAGVVGWMNGTALKKEDITITKPE